MIPIDETGETEDVASEAGTVGQQTVEPTNFRGDEFYNHSDVYHSEQSARSDDVPLPTTEENETADEGENDESGVDIDFHLRKLTSGQPADSYGKSFARHGNRATFHFESYSDCHNRASGELGQSAHRDRVTDQR